MLSLIKCSVSNRLISRVKFFKAELSWPRSVEHMFIIVVKLNSFLLLPVTGKHEATFLVWILPAVIAKCAYSQGFKINVNVVTISDEAFPLYLGCSLIMWEAVTFLSRTLTFWKRHTHTFLITLQRAGYFCCRKFSKEADEQKQPRRLSSVWLICAAVGN